MSYADTIRQALYASTREGALAPVPGEPVGDAHLALDALVAERRYLRDALEQAHGDLESILPPRGHEELAQGVYFAHQRLDKKLAALDGTSSEDAWHCPDCGWKGVEPEELDVFDSDGMERIAYLCPNCGGTDLNRTPSAAQTLEDPTPHKEKDASSHGS